MNDEFTYRAQDVSYLGFLETQLRDMQGLSTLTYELIQNADDVQDAAGQPGSSWISFDVRDDALIVENDGVFRPLDFERLQTIAGGGKRVETRTTGAFGLGFLAVYQITDAPQIFSGDRHWTIRPEADPAERIEEREAASVGTRLRLPWAFDPASPVRQALRLPAVEREALDDVAQAIAQALELAALFLRQLQCLEVKRRGEVVRRIRRTVEEGDGPGRRLSLQDEGGQRATWLLFQVEFAEAAAGLRARFPQIEAERETEVTLALPLAALAQQGRLFAGLPTGSKSPLPFHINADFFPTSDRKRIHFDGGYQAAWNRLALQRAADLLANRLEGVRAELPPPAFWQLLRQIAYTRELADQGEVPAAFATFWRSLLPLLGELPILYTVEGEWVRAGNGRVPPAPPGSELLPILKGLALPLADPVLAPYLELMRSPEIGVPPLTVIDLVEALAQVGLTRTTPLHAAPPFLRTLAAWQTLWRLFDRLADPYPQPAERAEERRLLGRVALVLTEAMNLERPARVFRGGAEARALFPDVAWVHPEIPERGIPGRLVTDFGVRQAVERLAEMPVEQLEDGWRLGRLDLPRLFRWFEAHQIEIFADDPALQREIRRLPLCPVGGELRPLAHLYIAGGFEDPLGLAGIVPLEALGGRRQFIEDLGVEPLSFDAYVHRELPRALDRHPDLPSDARHRLLQLLAGRLGEIRDDEALRDQLAHLPLVPCLDGSFRPGQEVYATRTARTVLGEGTHVAEPAAGEAQAALFRWLGVRVEPARSDLVQRLAEIAAVAEGAAGVVENQLLETTHQIWLRLQRYLEIGELAPDDLHALQGKRVIPAGERLFAASDLLFADVPALAEQFSGLKSHLVEQEEPAAPVWALAGVRPLSTAVRRSAHTPGGTRPAATIQALIGERLPLIGRVVRAEGGDLSAMALFDKLQVVAATPLAVEYHLTLGDVVRLSVPQPAQAVLEREQHRLYVDDELVPPWLAIARELATALGGARRSAGLALTLKEVLAAETAGAARQLLDELGLPGHFS